MSGDLAWLGIHHLRDASPPESHCNLRRLDASVPDHPVLIELQLAHPQPA